MKKRFLCALLTLIMLVSLVPATALTASAASYSTSEAAITVLKQWNGYRTNCKSDGYTGYGTPCTVKATHGTGTHTISEKQADAALRAALKDLDKAINTFASNAGISLTQSQHDALVLFSFDNGTAWTTGTGSFRSAVVNRLTGNAFLNAIGWWNASTADDNRRMVEANMYLNGAYSSVAPDRFIRVTYIAGGYMEEGEKIPTTDFSAEELAFYSSSDAKDMGIKVKGGYVTFPGVTYEGALAQAEHRYYDTATNPVADVIPTMDNHKFMGWYSTQTDGHQITSLKYSRTLYAHWQRYDAIPNGNAPETGTVWYIKEYKKAALYAEDSKSLELKFKELGYTANGNLTIDSEYLDETGMRWGRVIHAQELYRDKDGKKTTDVSAPLVKGYPNVWIKLGKASFNNGLNNVGGNSYTTDVTVTVTNAYVRIRSEDSIYSTELRRANMGETLRIVDTSHADGFLWGQIADAKGKAIGWVALMYTNYESVKNQGNTVVSQNVIGNATIVKPVNGYVNLRSGAGTDKQIVGALAYKTRVPLYEITYVNGIRWGRTDSGWFSLQYAEVDGVDVDDYNTNANVLAYSFVGNIKFEFGYEIHEKPSDDSTLLTIKPDFEPNNRVISHLTLDNAGNTWGKIAEGWVKVSKKSSAPANVVLNLARYQVIVDTLSVRENPDHAARRVDTLVKGVEFNVNVNNSQVIVVGDSVWAKAFKVGEDNPTYMGWVNLLATHVTRVDAPSAEKKENTTEHFTNKKATIVNTDNVNVREYTDATYAKIGSLARGTTVAVWEEEDGWYKIDSNRNNKYDYEGDGWVSGQYLNIVEDTTSTGTAGAAGTASGNVETGMGVIANTYTGVNVRSGAGTGYAAKGKILAGSTVEILEVKTVGSSKWGRVTQGWICMDYVTMISKYAIAGSTTSTGAAGGTSSSTNTTASETVIFTGKIKEATKVCAEPSILALNSTGKDIQKVRDVKKNTPVTVHELMVVEETIVKTHADDPSIPENETRSTTTKYYWARTNDGYIKDPGQYIELDPLAEKTYTVTSYVSNTDNCLRIYEANCADKKETLTLNKYDQVSVTTLKIVDNQLWCRVEFTDENGYNHEGYVQMKYLTNGVVSKPSTNTNNTTNNNTNNNTTNNVVIGSSGNTANQGNNGYVNNASGYRYTGRVIRTGSVNVRANPSQGAGLTTTLKSGAALVIYETVVSEGMAWGRCDAGWVYLYYVDLQPCNNAVDAKVVYNENTIAYTDANCTGVAGTYSRMSVVDIYEQVGSMCRTDLGWVHIDNLG